MSSEKSKKAKKTKSSKKETTHHSTLVPSEHIRDRVKELDGERRVYILYTGGTIGMKKDYDSGSLVPFDFAHLIEHIPELSHLDCELKVITLSLIKDSSDIGLNEWLEMSKIIETN